MKTVDRSIDRSELGGESTVLCDSQFLAYTIIRPRGYSNLDLLVLS